MTPGYLRPSSKDELGNRRGGGDPRDEVFFWSKATARYVSDDCSLEDLFAVLTIGHPKERKGVRSSLVHGQKYLRLDVPNFEQVAPRVAQLEQILNFLLATSNGKDWMPAMPHAGNARTVLSNRPLTLREATRCRRFAPMRF